MDIRYNLPEFFYLSPLLFVEKKKRTKDVHCNYLRFVLANLLKLGLIYSFIYFAITPTLKFGFWSGED